MLPEFDRQARAAQIQLFAMDVDGVLTRGDILYTTGGEEIKIFNVKDGHGLALLSHYGLQLALVTGRKSSATIRRGEELHIQHIHQGIKKKLPIVQEIAHSLNIPLSAIAYMGDDTPDLPVLQAVGLAVCPADAVDAVKAASHWITDRRGGEGAVREVCDLILSARFGYLPGDEVSSLPVPLHAASAASAT